MHDLASQGAANSAALLAPGEPTPVEIYRPDGGSRLLIVCDHAGKAIPRKLGRLGLPESEIERHIGWDIGIAGVVRAMADALDATAILQPYSRLVIDCNRTPGTPSSIPAISENTEIPGNDRLVAEEIAARQSEIFAPYHAAITAELDRRQTAGEHTMLIAMHSFTPIYKGVSRPWHVGTLYHRQLWLAGVVFDLLSREKGLVVGDNEPYMVRDDVDYTIPVHGERRNIPHVGIEIRQDLIASEVGQREWAALMTRVFREAEKRVQA
ncbi:MAG TPA: N-formylglutamate amidohydrolase [Pseudorhodoplanes sp.]|jgi:predicted N-formylglutamate amidohydrolase|nr:N-formylglutamate amidohydrolase [Pseudorhodoplanes sp.]